MADLSFMVDAFGVFGPGRVRVVWRDEPRPTNAPLDALVAQSWAEALHEAERSGAILFNGQLARYLRHRVQEEALCIEVGQTDYAQFMGTNYLNHARGDEFGWDLFSNPIGTTATLITTDDWLLYGRRSERVACHAGYVHTFGGGLEAGERNAAGEFDVFGSVRRELAEELGLRAAEISSMVCLGLIRDATIRQPELIFDAHLTLTRAEVGTRLSHDREHEHDAVVACRDNPDAIVPFVLAAGRIAPVAVGALCQHGRRCFGDQWYEDTVRRIECEVRSEN